MQGGFRNQSYIVQCRECGCSTPQFYEPEKATKLWNSRASTTDTEDGAALRAAISKDEPATASTLRFLRERYQQRKCDSDAVADCTRCQVMFLVRRLEDIRAAALR
jgi:hypothetical protein